MVLGSTVNAAQVPSSVHESGDHWHRLACLVLRKRIGALRTRLLVGHEVVRQGCGKAVLEVDPHELRVLHEELVSQRAVALHPLLTFPIASLRFAVRFRSCSAATAYTFRHEFVADKEGHKDLVLALAPALDTGQAFAPRGAVAARLVLVHEGLRTRAVRHVRHVPLRPALLVRYLSPESNSIGPRPDDHGPGLHNREVDD
mmetsp:Transcript_9294/g.21831  ORF Transcript_9294/g.21831 Transcript_9294/m.21831 type:complete len:201 (+) Transcript_9294:1378-1980(+)